MMREKTLLFSVKKRNDMSNRELWNYIPVWLAEFVDRKYIKKKRGRLAVFLFFFPFKLI